MPKAKTEKQAPDRSLEASYAAMGYKAVCGTDEAGRGPLAGPVYAAAVILPEGIEIPGLNDSKKLSEKRREKLFDIILESAICSIASASVEEIEELNILNAAQLAMRRAVAALPACDLALVDGNIAHDFPVKAVTVIGGDTKSESIAAASILAKVSRDRVMYEADRLYPEYGFANHKGYPTAVHREAVMKYGPAPIHRLSFLRNIPYGK